MSAPVITDPQQTAFWASDPSRLTDPNALTGTLTAPAPEHRTRLALEIAAAFLVCARLVRLALAGKHAVEDPRATVDKAWADVLPVFTSLTATALGDSLRMDPATAEVSIAAVSKIASQYAKGLGAYLGATSADAFTAAVDRQLSGRWSDTVSWARAAAGFGMDNQGYAAFLANAASVVDVDVVTPAAQALADASLLTRAQLVGESEAQTAGETAKVLHWQQMQQAGVLPDTARRKWVADEHEDCAVCAALDRQVVPLDEPFTLEDLQLWSPQAHPNCRCHLELVDVVGKAWDPQQHPRGHTGNSGEFRRKVAVAEPEQLLLIPPAEEEDVAEEKANPFAGPAKANPFATNPFAGARNAAAAFAPAKANPFAPQASDAFRSTAVGAFRPSTPQLRILRRTVLVPPPLMPKRGYPFYLPADHFHAQVNQHDMHTLFGLNTTFDMDIAQRGDVHVAAIADPTPWDSLRYSDVAQGRVRGGYFHDDHGNIGWRPKLSQLDAESMWSVILPDAVKGWSEAIDGARSIDNPHEGIAAALDPLDRRNIADLAGFTDYSSDQDLTTKIQDAAEKLGSGNDSLAAAYADYVVYNRPDKLDSNGPQIMTNIGMARDAGLDLQVRPADQVLNFQSGFHRGTPVTESQAEPVGRYMVTHLSYRSAIADNGLGARPLNIGIQVADVQPFIERERGFL